MEPLALAICVVVILSWCCVVVTILSVVEFLQVSGLSSNATRVISRLVGKKEREWMKRSPTFWERCYDLSLSIGDADGAEHYKSMYERSLAFRRIKR